MPDGDKCHGKKVKLVKQQRVTVGGQGVLLQTEQHLSNDLKKVRVTLYEHLEREKF